MVTCKEIDDYIAYMDAHPTWINKDRRLLIENVVRPLMARDDVTFDDHTYHNCIRYCEANYYPLFPTRNLSMRSFSCTFRTERSASGKFS